MEELLTIFNYFKTYPLQYIGIEKQKQSFQLITNLFGRENK